MSQAIPIRAADTAAIVSAATAGVSWLSQLQGWLSLLATVIAIVSGLYAIRAHRKNLKK